MTIDNISRRQVLKATAIGALGTVVLPGNLFAATTWDMPSAYGAGNFISKAYIAFAEDVETRTNGDLAITVHAGGSLYGGSDIMRAVREGQVPIGARYLGAHAAEAPVFGLDSVPFLATSKEEAARLFSVSRAAVDAALAERGLKLLFAPVWPPQGLFSKTAVTSIEDMQGRKFRAVSASTTRLAELMGAVPTKTEASEIAQAFSTGVADSMIASGAIGVFQKIWDYAEYFYLVNAYLPKSAVLVNVDAWDALDGATQAAVQEAASAAETAVWDEMEVQNAGYIQTMTENGMNVEEPSASLSSGLKAIGETMTAEWIAEAGTEGEGIIADYRAG